MVILFLTYHNYGRLIFSEKKSPAAVDCSEMAGETEGKVK
jgi:hypothetical protein